ncbi:hypothetical protein BC826DRAFT_1065777 [Russula brevipes]|nr:hypothetical protein BC826DRAFT_1065777 [Russula brevipes]
MSLEEFEWIGYPELQADMVQVLLKSHSNLNQTWSYIPLDYLPVRVRLLTFRIASSGWYFDAVGVSEFTSLKRLPFPAEA